MSARVFIVAGQRTAFGAFGGALKGQSATALCVAATKAAIAQAKISPELIDTVVVGSVQQTSPDAAYMARHVALKSGMKETTSALNINRLCGSGFQSCVNVAQEIKLGEAAIGVAAGAESMSQAPMSVYGHEVRWGTKLGSPTEMKDTLWAGLTDSHAGIPMGVTAENLAADYSITRGESDAYALESQARWAKAKAAGKFDDEIAPIELKSRKGPITFDTCATPLLQTHARLPASKPTLVCPPPNPCSSARLQTHARLPASKSMLVCPPCLTRAYVIVPRDGSDEHPKPTTTPAQMAKLPTTFKKDGVVTPASASGICDGAGALILASEAAVKQHGLEPLCELVGWASVGVDPTRMGIGPVPAIRAALDRAGMSMVDIDRVEINEAFAPQIMACAKELGLDMAKTNINGGAIALGHPLGASGSRITMHLAHAIKRGEVKAAIGSACIGGGQGIALVLKEAEM